MRSSATLLLVLALSPSTPTQGPRQPIPLEVAVERPAELQPKIPDLAWIPGDRAAVRAVLAPREPGQPTLVQRIDVRTRERRPLFDAHTLRTALRLGGAKIADGQGLPEFRMTGPRQVRVLADGALHDWDLDADRSARRLTLLPGTSARNPDDTAVAAVVDDDLVVREASDVTRRLTFDGRAEDIVYGGAAHRAEFGIHDGLWWDPTGRFLAFSREDMRPIAAFPYADLRTLPARPRHGRYPMAGQTHSKVTIGVFDRRTARLVYLEHDPDADLYWTNVTFTPDGGQVLVALVDRAQSNMELVAFDAASGARLRTLLTESDPEWVEPEHGPIFLPDGSGFLWFSSRDGHRHLWRHAPDGRLLWKETEGRFDIREFRGFAADGAHAWVVASGPDPRQQHLYEVRLGRPEPPMLLTADPRPKMRSLTGYGPGWHEVQVADDGSVLDVWSSMFRPGYVMVLPRGGTRTMLEQVEDPLAPYLVGNQQMFELETADGARLYGHVMLPPNPDPLRKHPVLLYVYGGPKAQLVQDRWQGGASAWLQYMASQGYVVVRVDGRGTPNRGIEFEQEVHRHLGEIEVIDQLAGLDWVGRNVACADLRRVGVHGWSYGGYMTLRLMLLAPEQFVCGVSGAPVTDWRRYETGYGERYMDTPAENADGYEASSVLPLVGRLKGRLLLVHGTDDRTVMWSHATALLERAVDEGVLVDFMAYPMQQHGLRGKARGHFLRLMTRYFAEHLPAPEAAGRPVGVAGADDAQADGDTGVEVRR
jgi:dipeptidyl aminopeptidase/acylaminoacyl peptidase